MKRRFLIFALVICVVFASLCFVACKDNESEKEQDDSTKEYAISIEQSADYKITSSESKAVAGTKINVSVEVLNSDKYLTGVYFNDQKCIAEDNIYTFEMPKKDVKLSATLNDYVEVKTDGMATFDENNNTQIIKNATFNESSVIKKEWGFDIAFDVQHMTILNSKITSSNQNVIFDEAISLVPLYEHQSNVIIGAKVYINTSVVNKGSTWLTMSFENGNQSSNESILTIKVTVVEESDIVLETIKETIKIDVSEFDQNSNYTVRLCDIDNILPSTPSAVDYKVQAVEGILTIEFDYVVGHNYWIRVTLGEEDNFQSDILLEDEKLDGGEYTGDVNYSGSGILTFSSENTVLTLKAYKK